MTKICFPHHVRGDFDSLEEAYKFFIGTKGGFTKYILGDIVRYNMRYRNQLRTLGYQALENLLIEDGCPVAKDFEMYSYLHNYLYKQERLCCRNYDIQCYNIKDKITILGHTFNGLEDIAAHCEIVAKEHSMGVTYNVPYEYRVYRDIHVGKFYADYPCFDSFDACDNRSYQNFIFRKEQITCEEMRRTLKAVPDIVQFKVKTNDRIFLCSDGVYKAMAPQILTVRLQDKKPLEEVVDVIKFMCEKYSKDNYTGILVEIK